MSIEMQVAPYTEAEKKQIGRAFGTKELFQKFRRSIINAVMVAPAFFEKIRAIVAEQVKEINLRIESLSNDLPKMIQTEVAHQLADSDKATSLDEKVIGAQLDAALRDPAKAIIIVEAILANDTAREVLQRGLYLQEKTAIEQARQRRRENLTGAVIAFYRDRNPHDVETNINIANDVQPLVELIETEGVVKGKQTRMYDATVGEWITDRETKMAEVVAGLCKRNTKQELIDGHAGRLVEKGFDPNDSEAVKAEISVQSDIADKIKK